MTAREVMLRRVRSTEAVGRPTAVAPPRGYRRAGTDVRSGPELVALLVDRLVDYRAVVTETTETQAAEAISGVLARHRAGSVVVPYGFPVSALPSVERVVRDAPPLSAVDLDAIDAVVTTSVVAVAETGTIVLDAGPGMGRRALTLVPDLHILVVRTEDVVRGVPEALTRLDPNRPLTWISGPSATSDIELSRVEGVHGPRRLEVILLGAEVDWMAAGTSPKDQVHTTETRRG
jgi:L-lactate dehydrogenase complex protein LldG